MLDSCEKFSSSISMLFSTDPVPAKGKNKCLFFTRKRSSDQIKNVTLNGDNLPWVATAKHLGNHLSSKLNFSSYSPETKTDILCKRAILFDKVHQISQQFGFYKPELLINLISIYSTALYGSTLWQLASEEHLKLNRSWNTAAKIVWDLPHPTHTRFLESLSPVLHLESILSGRYIGLAQGLTKSSKPLIKLLFNSCISDLGSQTGHNVDCLLLDLVTDKNCIKKSRVVTLSENEKWKLNIIEEVSLMRKGHLEVTEIDDKMLEEILDYVCTY